MRIKALCIVGVLCTLVGPVRGQDSEAPRARDRERPWPGRRGEQGRGDDEGQREAWRARRREMMERMEKATPEERRQMRVERWVDRLSRTYELDDGQREIVQAEVDKMSRDYYAELGPDALRMDELRMNMQRFWRDVRERNEGGEEVDWRAMANSETFRKMREELDSIREDHPFDWDASIENVEKLLPPEQVEAGRQRRAEREERRREWQERRANGEWGGRGGRGGGRGGRWRGGPGGPGGARDEVVQRSEWEAYTIRIIEKYNYDSAQINSARSILKDIQDRAAVIERALNNPTALDAPLGELFRELRSRLEELATQQQRKDASGEAL